DPDNLPFTRTPLCNDNAFGEKSAVHRERGEREKVDGFSNNTKAVNGWTGEKPGIAPFLEISADSDPADDGLDLPPPSLSALQWHGRGQCSGPARPHRLAAPRVRGRLAREDEDNPTSPRSPCGDAA